MEVDENICKYCNEILKSDIIQQEKSFEELAIELKNSRPPNVEYKEENKLRTSGIIKWLLQNATEQTIDESDIEKIVDQCVYSEESEIIDILKSHGVFIVIHRDIDVKSLDDYVKSAANELIWQNSAICLAIKKGPVEIMTWLLNFQINADIVKNEHLLNKLLENAAEAGNLGAIKNLVELGADIHHCYDDKDTCLVTVLETATQKGYQHVVEWLVNNFKVENYILENSLQCAVKNEKYDLIKLFVELKTIDMSCENGDEENYIHLAARNRNVSVIKYLKEHGTELLSENEDGLTVVHIAAENGDLNLLKWLNSQGALEYAKNCEYTPLNEGAENGQLECVKYLVHNNFDVNSKTHVGSVLHCAVKSGNIEMVKFLVSHGANPLVIDDNHNTLLHVAIHNDRLDSSNKSSESNIKLLMLLASYGINLHAKNSNEKTVLHLALKYNDYLVVKWLLDKGMDSNVVVSLAKSWAYCCSLSNDWRILHMCIELMTNINQLINGKTLLYICAPYPEAVKILIDKNADVNIKSLVKGETPLMESLRRYLDTAGAAAQILLDHGADVNAISIDGKSALYVAVWERKDIKLIKQLIELGANVNAGNPFRNHLILHAAVQRTGDLDIVKCLVEAGVDVNCKNSKNETAIYLCFYRKNDNWWKIVKYLVEKGADVNHFTKKPILFEAIETGDVELVSCLLHHGARTDIIFEDDDDAILHRCSKISDEASKIKIVKLLITHGADINGLSYDDEETILLHFITNIEMVDYLINAGIDINIEDAYGSTALHYALLKENYRNNIHNQIKIALKLINHGANINHIDGDDNTPLHLAVANPHCSEVAKLLVKKGANVNAKNGGGDSILHDTCLGELGMWLISKGANVHATNNHGVTVLQKALQKFPNHDLKCQNIVNSIVNCSIKYNPIPSTTLASINTSRYIEYIHLLIDIVYDVNIINERGLTALHYVVSTDNVDLLDHLFKKGAIVLSRTLDGDSVLHLAVHHSKVNIVKYLLKEQNHELLFKGNNANETPLDIAVKGNNVEIIQMLTNHIKGGH